MAIPFRLSAEKLDDIAQLLRLGLALNLTGFAIATYTLIQGPPLSPTDLWDAFDIHGDAADFLTGRFFAGDDPFFTPRRFIAMVFGLQVVGAFAILFGLVTRFFAGLFMTVAFLIWGAHFIDATPWLLTKENISVLAGPVAELRQISTGFLFLALLHLGAGSNSLDARFRLSSSKLTGVSWNTIGLQLRLAIALFFFGGAISEYVFNAPYYEPSWLTLSVVGFLVLFGQGHRTTGAMSLMLIGWHLYIVLSKVNTFSQALALFLPETPLIVAGLVFLVAGGGEHLKPKLIETKWGRVS